MSEIIQYMGSKKENIGWKQSGLLHYDSCGRNVEKFLGTKQKMFYYLLLVSNTNFSKL